MLGDFGLSALAKLPGYSVFNCIFSGSCDGPEWAEAIQAAIMPAGRAGAAAEGAVEATADAAGANLAKQLGSEEGVAELSNGGGKAIAGAGTGIPIRDVGRLVSEHGGSADDWVKVTSTAPGHLQTHAYRNINTGEVVELKSIVP